jgi:ABC-2 type transport system permease protein
MAVKGEARAFLSAVRLGWGLESNWTDPFLFAVYSVVKPLAAALIIVYMFVVVTGAKTQTALFAYAYLGNCFFLYAHSLLFGMAWVIIEDREFYETLKSLYASPMRIHTYLVGRLVAKVAISTVAVVVTLGFGVLLLKIQIRAGFLLDGSFWLLFGLGLLNLGAFGVILAGITLNIARHSTYTSESVVGTFFLLCGVLFPLEVLPAWLRPASKLIPVTYWLEGVRRIVLGYSVCEELSGLSDANLLAILAISTAGLLVAARYFYRAAQSVAKNRDALTGTTDF